MTGLLDCSMVQIVGYFILTAFLSVVRARVQTNKSGNNNYAIKKPEVPLFQSQDTAKTLKYFTEDSSYVFYYWKIVTD